MQCEVPDATVESVVTGVNRESLGSSFEHLWKREKVSAPPSKSCFFQGEMDSVTLGDLAGWDLVFQMLPQNLDFLFGGVPFPLPGLGHDGLLCGWFSCSKVTLSLSNCD